MTEAAWVAILNKLIENIPAILVALGGIITILIGQNRLKGAVIKPLDAIHSLVNANLAGERRRAEIAEAKLAEAEARAVALAKKNGTYYPRSTFKGEVK